MGFWLNEDYLDKNREYNEMFSSKNRTAYSSWREERKTIIDQLKKPDTFRSSQNFDNQKETVRYLKKLIERLRFRINISLSAEGVSTHFIKMIVRTFRDELQDTIDEVNRRIADLHKYGSIEIEQISATDEVEEKKIFILQVINHIVTVTITNAEYLSEAEMKSISQDIWALIQWYYDDGRLFGVLPDNEVSPQKVTDFFIKEFNTGACRCSRCGRETARASNKCLFCGESFKE